MSSLMCMDKHAHLYIHRAEYWLAGISAQKIVGFGISYNGSLIAGMSVCLLNAYLFLCSPNTHHTSLFAMACNVQSHTFHI